MLKAESSWLDLRCLEALSSQTALLQQLHPTTKLLTTLLFLLTLASFNKYELSALLPLCLYPIGLCTLGGIPPAIIAKRLLIAAPVVLMLGLFNPFFDQAIYILPGGFAISKGWVSFGVIACKLLRVIYTILTKGTVYDPKKLMADIKRPGRLEPVAA